MGRIVIFTDDPGWHGAQLRQAFAGKGYIGEYVSLTQCRIQVEAGKLPIYIPGFEQYLPDAAFVRGVPGGSLEEVVFYLDILHALKVLGIPVYNDGQAIERSVDKGMTSFLLHNAGLPTPMSWVARNREAAVLIAEKQLRNKNTIITKPLFGSQGEGLRRFEKMTDLFWLTGSRGIYYMQHFIESAGDGYSDWRVFVINGQVVACMRRRGVCWLNNVARGARCEAADSDDDMDIIALKATQVLGMDYSGVDIIRDQQGNYTVIEVNSIPAWKGLQSVCAVNVAELLAEDLIEGHINQSKIQLQAAVS